MARVPDLIWGMDSERVPTLYDWVGGSAALEALFQRFYEHVRADALLAPIFASMDPQHHVHVAAFVAEVFGGRMPTLVQTQTLSRFLDANSPQIDSATPSPYEGATSYQFIPASYARSSVSMPLRVPIREPSEAQPKPMLETLLPIASTKTSFMAKTRFHAGIKCAVISVE